MLAIIIDSISTFMYSKLLVVLLIGAGIYFTIRTKLPQMRLFKDACKAVVEKPEDENGVSSFQALMVSTASRVGTGNIIGVSSAICIGGFGSVFWMWVIAIIGSASALIESTLAQIYMEQKEEAEIHFKEAIKLAKETEEYDHLAKICKRCSLYYQKYGNFDEALEMERKAYASQLMLNDGKSDSSVILSSALGMFGVMSLLLGLLWKKNRHALSQLDLFKEEILKKDVESDKLILQCNHLEEKYQSLQLHIYESSPVVSKVRQFKERNVLSSKIPSFSEKDWTELLRLQENVYGLVSKLKEIGPKLTEEDLRVCAFLREGVQPACFADLMKLTTETLTRRISRIKTEKLMLANSKESLEDIVKSLGDLSFCARN